jgi:dienelactone hydrolase
MATRSVKIAIRIVALLSLAGTAMFAQGAGRPTIPLVSAQDLATKQLATRTELHPIQTLTISDQQFLNGEGVGSQAATVVGEFRIAQGAGRLPVVVIVPGSSGIGAGNETWVRQFNEMGVSTFVLDGLTGRGLTNVNADQALLGRLNLIVDAYRALDILAKHPRVDPSRIMLMGFSRGGQAALYAGVKRFQRMWNKSNVEFSAYVPFYPDCSTSYLADVDVADRPIRIFHGTADDYDPVAPCRAYVERLRAAGRDVQLTEYAGAQHGFDGPLGSLTPAVATNSQTVRHCSIREEPMGQLINAATRQPFSYKDSCVELSPHTGYDPVASRAAHQSVADFVKALFKLT